MSTRYSRSVVLALILALAACAARPAGGASAGGPPAGPEPFPTFLSGVEHATFDDYAQRPGRRVRDAAAFAEMRGYLLDRYREADVVSSYASGDAVFDCQRWATGPASARPSPVDGPASGSAAPAAGPAGSSAAQATGCPAGTVPVRRISLNDLVRFPTLAAFLGKAPGGGARPPVPSPTG